MKQVGNMHYVYYLLDPDTLELLYIGRSNNPKHRLFAFRKKKQRDAILGVCQRYSDFERACKAELRAIAKHWPPYNKSLISSLGKLGQSTGVGYKLSEEHKAKIARAGMGRALSEEAKESIRRKLKGHVVSEATRKKIGDANRGRKMPPKSPELRKRLSIATTEHYQRLKEAHAFGGFTGGATITKTRKGSSISQY